jgi:hypothetical protein
MPASSESRNNETPDQQPLVGRFVHLAVVLGVIAGCGMLGWARAGGAFGVLFGVLAVLGSSVLWLGTGSVHDPERSRPPWFPISGPIRLGLEVGLIVVAGIGIWIAWNRAAGETFLTVAAIDFAVRYQRIASLLRSR